MKPTIEEKQLFSSEIINLVTKSGLEYIEAIVEYCEQTGLEVESAASLLTPMIKSKIAEEAVSSKMIKPFARLPI